MNNVALDDALEARGWLGILRSVGDEIVQLGFEIRDEAPAQLFQVHIARPHHGGRILILDQRQQEMLERGVLMMPLVGESKRPVKRLFEATRKRWHFRFSSFVSDAPPRESLFLHYALQRMLMLSSEVHD